MNAIELLKDDHKTLRKLLADLSETTKRAGKTRTELLARIAKEIGVHSKIEEEIFYPAFKDAVGEGDDEAMYFEALEEHHAAGDLVLPDLLATDVTSDKFSGRAKVLKEMIEHHIGKEEKEMLPRARELLDAATLRTLGERMGARKAELMAEPSLKSLGSKLIGAVASAISPDSDSDEEISLHADGTSNGVPSPAARKSGAGRPKSGGNARRGQ